MQEEETKEQHISEKNAQRRKLTCRNYLKRLLINLSQGYYRTELYLEGKQRHASVVGGIITLLGMFAVIGYAIYILYGVFTQQTIHVETTILETGNSTFNLKVSELLDITNFQFTMNVNNTSKDTDVCPK